MYETLSIAQQQSNWIITELTDRDTRFDTIDKQMTVVIVKVEMLSRLKEKLFAKWTVVTFLFLSICGPLLLAFAGALFVRWIGKVWK
jgi:hypothetical protein